MGASIACGMAVTYPDVIARVVLLNGVLRRDEPAKAAVQARAADMRAGQIDIETPHQRWFDATAIIVPGHMVNLTAPDALTARLVDWLSHWVNERAFDAVFFVCPHGANLGRSGSKTPVWGICRPGQDGGSRRYAPVWTGELHGMDSTIAPDPFLNLIDLARQTTQVRLGTGTITAPFRHPIRIAGEAAMADLIMDGRLDLGIARGAYSYEYERMVPGMDAWDAGRRMRELAPAVQRLWQADFAQQATYHSCPPTTSSPVISRGIRPKTSPRRHLNPAENLRSSCSKTPTPKIRR